MSNNSKKITVMVDSDLDFEFRKIASNKFKFKRGWYTKAINEAINQWVIKYRDDFD